MKKWIYRFVLKELVRVPMFRGIYDAKHGKKEFMQGIFTVMEYICYRAGKEEFANEFIDNMIGSEKKADV